MPYLGLQNGEEVIPPQVPDSADLTCPDCSEELVVVQSHRRNGAFVSRHFSHTAASQEDCPGGGESRKHRRMKAIAFSKLAAEFPEATIQLEEAIDDHIPDIRVEFPEPQPPYGEGIAVEVQYRNKGKDIGGVTDYYFERAYSVLWLYEDDFDTHNVDISGVRSVWPHGVDHEFEETANDAVQRLCGKRDRSPVERDVPLPPELPQQYEGDLRQAWKMGRLARGAENEGDVCFEWLSEPEKAHSKWIRVTEKPDGQHVLQLGKEFDDLEQVMVPVNVDSRQNRGKMHSLAYAVEESDWETGNGWTDLESVWLNTPDYHTGLLVKIVSTPMDELGISVMRYEEDRRGDGEIEDFTTVAPDAGVDAKQALHTVAEALGNG